MIPREMILEMLLPVLGAALLTIAVVLLAIVVIVLVRGRPLDSTPFHLEVPKLGLTLKGDRLTLLTIVACMVALVPIGFSYQSYGKRLKDIEAKLMVEQDHGKLFEEALNRMKSYDMTVIAELPPNEEGIDLKDLATRVQVVVTRAGAAAPKVERARSSYLGPANDLWINVDRLNPGDQFQIVIDAGGSRKWITDKIEIPHTHLTLHTLPSR